MQRCQPILNNNCQNFRSVKLLFQHVWVWAWAPEGDVHPGQGPQSGPLSAPSAAEDTNQPRGPGHRLRESSHQRAQGGHGCL